MARESVKTTRIEKKYTDRKTGEQKQITIDFAKVNDRLLRFWEDNPKGRITPRFIKEGNDFIFETHILADKSDPYSREATGHAYASMDGEKSFEKLETISVGRALALLGYSGSGEIASVEEMSRYREFIEHERLQTINTAVDTIEAMTDLEKLKQYYLSLAPEVAQHEEVIKAKDSKKAELV